MLSVWNLNFRFLEVSCYLFILIFIQTLNLKAQDLNEIYLLHLSELKSVNNSDDFDDYLISNQHTSKRSGLLHTYIQQRYQGITVRDGVLSIHQKSDGSLTQLNDQFIRNLSSKINSEVPLLSSLECLLKIANDFGYNYTLPIQTIEKKETQDQQTVFAKSGISTEDIPARLIYFPINENQLKLSWEFFIHETDASNWWQIVIDAETGDILERRNLYLNCDFGHPDYNNQICSHKALKHFRMPGIYDVTESESETISNAYRVYPLGVESPSHGGRVLVINPADSIASPYGWHDTNGVTGAEHTTTKGNNVEAREDIDGNNNTLGAMAQGGPDLVFDFPIDFTQQPAVSQNAAITNLFYWNNVIHDVFYQYGFDEPAGNFQQNNYGNGGLANDFVRADALDGESTNNANFATPPDGNNPRMQMFLWNPGSGITFTVNTPISVSGTYGASKAAFGSQTYSVSGDVVIANDGTGNPTLACNALTNGAVINGKIALIDRGSCEFGAKCLNAQNAGAIAVIVCNNVAGDPFSMGAGAVGNQVTIPCVMISQSNCNTLRLQIPGLTVSMTGTQSIQIDGDYDNCIITHEYGHGISIRLTGGAGNAGCLNNQEQMGEGWSDWFGLMLTMNESDIGSTPRGIGNYVISQPSNGNGIRPYPYTTNMSINPHTYDAIKTASIPHGIGSVWCAMLWELTWSLIAEYGFDPDIYRGTGGNNIALTLVTEALKLQPCSPGFVTGRDAILQADLALYGGIHQCMIWEAFAKRGLGFSAVQGSSNNRSDGTQAFNLPPSCCKYVRNTNNSGDYSLRSAINCAVAGDTIRFSPLLIGQAISLTEGPIVLNKNLNFKTRNPDAIRILAPESSPAFHIEENIEIFIEKLGLTGAQSGQIRSVINNGNLTLKDVIVRDKVLEDIGHIIKNEGQLTFEGSSSILKVN
jgi:extracellular elastinolytic metalloproteinase